MHFFKFPGAVVAYLEGFGGSTKHLGALGYIINAQTIDESYFIIKKSAA